MALQSLEDSQAAEDVQDEEFDTYFIVFDGSSPEDVSQAKQLWSSVSLQPPLESRLVSSDIRQRLPVARPHLRDASGAAAERGRSAPATTTTTTTTMPHGAHAACIPMLQQQQQRLQAEEEKRRYLAVAIQREEILALLQKRREQRIQKEMLARAFKPKMDSRAAKHERRPSDEELEMDKDIVQQLR